MATCDRGPPRPLPEALASASPIPFPSGPPEKELPPHTSPPRSCFPPFTYLMRTLTFSIYLGVSVAKLYFPRKRVIKFIGKELLTVACKLIKQLHRGTSDK